jgi:flagellar basal body P-ring formation protein FlgA
MKTRTLWVLWAFLAALPAFAASGQRIVVPTRDIVRGEQIELGDLVYQQAVGVQPGTVTAMRDVVGMETRRSLRAGESLRQQDFRRPVIVTKGMLVTMTYEEPGVLLSATGRAITAGGLGETVTVQNPVSFRQVGAVVIGPGQVRAVGNSMTITSQVSSSDR